MNLLHRLLIENRGKGLFRVDNKTADAATIYLYDVIVSDDFWGGVSALAFAKELAGLQAATVHLRINSPGGDVFAGQAIAQAIRDYPGQVIAHIDGVAASAASWVALAAAEVEIASGAMVMIHQAQGIAIGNAGDLRDTAALLDKIDATLVDGYARETAQSAAQITDWMTAETWFNADEAVKYGFADRLATAAASNSAAHPTPAWNLAAYAHAPVPLTPPAPVVVAPPVIVPPAPNNQTTEHLRRCLELVEKTAA